MGREMAEEKSNKSGQSTDELYLSDLIHYGKLAFLIPVIGASNSRDTWKRINLQENENKKEVGGTQVPKRKTHVEKKLDLLSKCTEAITANSNTKESLTHESTTTKRSAFSL